MEWVKEWLSNRVQCYTVTLRFASVSNHLRSVFCSVEYKRFTTKGEQTLSHFPEKLLITKAIYQLNKIQQSLAEYKFNQNTDFIFYRRVPGIASNILQNVSLQFTEILNYLHMHLYTLRLQKTKQDFSWALRQNPPGHWVIFVLSGQKSCTTII